MPRAFQSLRPPGGDCTTPQRVSAHNSVHPELDERAEKKVRAPGQQQTRTKAKRAYVPQPKPLPTPLAHLQHTVAPLSQKKQQLPPSGNKKNTQATGHDLACYKC